MTTIPVIDLARTGANIVNLRKAAGLSVHDLQVVFGFNSPQAIYKCKFRPLSHTCTDIQPRCHGVSATPSRSGATVVRGAVRPL